MYVYAHIFYDLPMLHSGFFFCRTTHPSLQMSGHYSCHPTLNSSTALARSPVCCLRRCTACTVYTVAYVQYVHYVHHVLYSMYSMYNMYYIVCTVCTECTICIV